MSFVVRLHSHTLLNWCRLRSDSADFKIIGDRPRHRYCISSKLASVVGYFAKSCASPDNPMAKTHRVGRQSSAYIWLGQPSERGFILHICCHKPCLTFAADVKTTSVETILSCREISVYKLTNIRFDETSTKVSSKSSPDAPNR